MPFAACSLTFAAFSAFRYLLNAFSLPFLDFSQVTAMAAKAANHSWYSMIVAYGKRAAINFHYCLSLTSHGLSLTFHCLSSSQLPFLDSSLPFTAFTALPWHSHCLLYWQYLKTTPPSGGLEGGMGGYNDSTAKASTQKPFDSVCTAVLRSDAHRPMRLPFGVMHAGQRCRVSARARPALAVQHRGKPSH